MAISQLNIKRILALKSKNDAPIRPHGHGPESLQIAF
jgi:hypothetical protein